MRQIALAAILLLVGCGAKRVAEFPELELARRQGLITTVEEAERRNMPLPNDISGLYISRAKIIDGPQLTALSRAVDIETAKAAFSNAKDQLKEISQIGESVDYTPQRNWRKGFLMDFGPFVEMKAVLRIFSSASWVSFENGDVRDGMRYLGMAANVAKQASLERTLIGKLVYAAMSAITVRTAARAAGYVKNDAAELEGILALLGDLPEPDFKDAFGYEIVLLRSELDLVRAGKRKMSDAFSMRDDFGVSGDPKLKALDKAGPDVVERVTIRHYADLAKVWKDRDSVEKWFAATAVANPKAPAEIVAMMLLLSHASMKDAELRQLSSLRATKIALAALIIRDGTRKWPTLLEAAKHAAQPTVDPFRKADLIYKVGKDGVVVYSVGPDGLDDGGVAKAPGTFPARFDVVARLPAPN